ncbi:Segment polarity protein dishevelled homolog DVL-3 [Eumeta japonica]|uniref:Segment polarity protein dishevelled homolog DVL-3 n=1 Tax=Eumeta variegata TaxID=151549 RepID=A0A4C1ZRA5_EUMVA|nr:Segment polarity protein dishevelled homolog DVL-3 [Eumeta japonica]
MLKVSSITSISVDNIASKFSYQKAGFIRHTVNKITFSEQCYYVGGELCADMAALRLGGRMRPRPPDADSLASDTIGALPNPGVMGPGYLPYAGSYGYQPIPFKYTSCPTSEHTIYGGGSSAGSDNLTAKEHIASREGEVKSTSSGSGASIGGGGGGAGGDGGGGGGGRRSHSSGSGDRPVLFL